MKEATGELSMTVVTIIAIVAILGIITFLTPKMKEFINEKWNEMTGSGSEPTGYVEIFQDYTNM